MSATTVTYMPTGQGAQTQGGVSGMPMKGKKPKMTAESMPQTMPSMQPGDMGAHDPSTSSGDSTSDNAIAHVKRHAPPHMMGK